MKGPDVTDAEFTVIGGHRIGDPHPAEPRWRYAGLDVNGRALWYRPPRFNRLQLVPLVVGALIAAWILLAVILWAIHPSRPY